MKQLALNAIIGLTNLLVIMGLLLFFAAGNLNYWEGWTYLMIFFLACLFITFYFLTHNPDLIRNRLKAGPIAERKFVQKLIQACASVFFISVFLIAGFDHRLGLSKVPGTIVILADLLMVLSFALIFFVFRANTFTSGTIELSPNQHVVSTGPYAVVRHPMYSGGLLLLIVTPLALGSWWSWLLDVPMSIVIVLRLLDEEKFLMDTLTDYRDYTLKVPYRLLPHIW